MAPDMFRRISNIVIMKVKWKMPALVQPSQLLGRILYLYNKSIYHS